MYMERHDTTSTRCVTLMYMSYECDYIGSALDCYGWPAKRQGIITNDVGLASQSRDLGCLPMTWLCVHTRIP